MRTTLRQLEAFFWTAKLGSIHAAAEHLNFSQPAISSRIKELEAALNLRLFTREKQRVQLTHDGRHAVTLAERALGAAHDFERMGRTGPPLEGVLRLGSDESTAMVALSEILQQLKRRHPRLVVEITMDVGSVLQEKLRRRQIDIALHTYSGSAAHVTDQLLGWVDFAWIASAEMPIPDGPFTPRIASRLPLVTNSPPSTLNSIVHRWLRSANIEGASINSCNSLSLMLRLVRERHAIAVLPLPVLREHLASGELRCLPASPAIANVAYYASYVADEADQGTAIVMETARSVLIEKRFFVKLPDGELLPAFEP
ncbi:LysR family transcriptional regulator [Comamonas endophytica]|uniref:LysR family transcriptional regulator n=1 Tax=Comamonas endophytica TaxID=2949090 RepID=A0ABY6GFY9_9BURK|nr:MULTISPECIES: LysR family transcriptional regulator [unclassified Acidovorax]MCD2513223.1 LysR family transcriptional regulator [Acidovorax sp. D4N7]UYG53432.1 LysR family transcriptional regulator [Acidovorax sp. 5MLIR]